MKEEIVNISDTRRSVAYAFNPEDVAAERESVIDKFCKQVKIPGFRQGKVPRNVVLARFPDGLKKQLESAIVDKAIGHLSSEHGDWNVAAIVDVRHEDADGGTICTLIIDIIPDFELPDYKNISIGPIDASVDEREVENEIVNILRQSAKYEIVDREAGNGDFAKVNYVGRFADGSNVEEVAGIPPIYGTQTNTWEEAGSQTSPGVRAVIDGIVGMKAGDRKTVSQEFEENFEVSPLAGKTVSYDIEVVEIRECVLPELTEDLLKTMGVKSEDDLREKVREAIGSRKTSQARLRQREELTAKLLEISDVKIPESSVDSEATSLANEFVDRQVREGANSNEIKRHFQEIFDSFKPVAAIRVKLGVILDKIAKDEKIEISTTDLENMTWQDMRTKKLDVRKYLAELKRDRSKIFDIRRRTMRGKALDHLMAMVCEDLATEEAIPASVAEGGGTIAKNETSAVEGEGQSA